METTFGTIKVMAPKETQTMLVVARKAGEAIILENSVVVRICAIRGKRVSLGIEAPRHIPIRRLPDDRANAENEVAEEVAASEG